MSTIPTSPVAATIDLTPVATVPPAEVNESAVKSIQPPPAVQLFGITLHRVTLAQAVAHIQTWFDQTDGPVRYVVTPNVDHLVLLDRDSAFRAAYRQAALTVADGWPVVRCAQLLGAALPERVAGSDLVPALFAAASPETPLRVFLLGAAPGVADTAARRIEGKFPAVRIVGTYSPPMGFEHDSTENTKILRTIAASRPDLLIVGLGAPKQEKWIYNHREEIAAKAAICAGATIDFLAGHRRRAPRWVQKVGLEWAYRMLSEPRRLAGRYAVDAWVFPRLVWRQLRQSRPKRVPPRTV